MRQLNRAMLGAVVWAVAGLVSAGGCGASAKPREPGRAFPVELDQAGTLDIQVVREETEIELTNTSATSFGPCTMWLNRRFSRPIDGLKIGETLRLRLGDFRDEYGDVFRAGGFFATELPERLVQAHLEVPGPDGAPTLVGLVVVAREETQ